MGLFSKPSVEQLKKSGQILEVGEVPAPPQPKQPEQEKQIDVGIYIARLCEEMHDQNKNIMENLKVIAQNQFILQGMIQGAGVKPGRPKKEVEEE